MRLSNIAFALIVVGAACFAALPVRADGCPVGTKQVGEQEEETADAIVVHPVCEELSAKELSNETARVAKRLETTRRSLKALPLRAGRLQADIDEWIDLNESSRDEARSALLDIGASLGVNFLNRRIDARGAAAILIDKKYLGVVPSMAGSPLQQLRAEAIRAITQARNERDIVAFIESFGQMSAIKIAAGNAALEPKDAKKWLGFALEVLKPFVKHPVVALAIDDAQLAIPVLYGWAVYSNGKDALEQLTKLGEDQYKEASTMTAMYVKDTDALKELKRIAAKRKN